MYINLIYGVLSVIPQNLKYVAGQLTNVWSPELKIGLTSSPLYRFILLKINYDTDSHRYTNMYRQQSKCF